MTWGPDQRAPFSVSVGETDLRVWVKKENSVLGRPAKLTCRERPVGIEVGVRDGGGVVQVDGMELVGYSTGCSSLRQCTMAGAQRAQASGT